LLKYEIDAFRLFKWSKDNWMEYEQAARDQFNLSPTKVIWLKRRLTSPIFYGIGRTASLRNDYRISVPAQGWVDFCLPYRFNIRVGDILAASKQQKDSSALLFYEWRRGSGDSLKRYYAEGIFLSQTPTVDSLTYELTARNGTVYTVYNRSASMVDLVIPGIPIPLSGVVGKQTAQKGWSIIIRASSDEGCMSPIYCGLNESNKGTIRYPSPPSWNKVNLGIFDRDRNGSFGSIIIPELSKEGGHTFELVFENGTGLRKRIHYRIERSTTPEKSFHTAVIDPENGALEATEDNLLLTVEPFGRSYRLLAVGSEEYLATIKNLPFRGEFKLQKTFPNPFSRFLRINYQIPYGSIEWIRCEVFDPRGRILWNLQIGPRLHPGNQEIVWTPRKEIAMAAGTYIIRLSGFDGRNRKIGERFTRATYLP
jgi:hypothetical protein